jgi:serine/threonine-protein kinase
MDSTPDDARPSPERSGPWTGQVIAGKYRLGALIGQGGTSEVYSALQSGLDREVAVKVLGEGADEDARARFLRETKIAAKIRHPAVAQVFDAGVDEGGHRYLVMELLEGESVADRIAQGRFDPAEAVAIVADVAMALQVVHDRGFLHRDLKPSNVFLARGPDGGVYPKLIDFGIAKRVAVDAEVRRRVTTLRGLNGPATALDIMVGTPLYMSPEQIKGDTVDARGDVYSLAATLYEMIAGTPPFLDSQLAQLLTKIVVEAPAPLARTAPEAGVSAALDREILRALSKDPGERHESAAAFATALRGALPADRSSDPPLPVEPTLRRARWMIPAIVAAALLAVAFMFRHPASPPAAAPPPPAATTAAPVPTTPEPEAAAPAPPPRAPESAPAPPPRQTTVSARSGRAPERAPPAPPAARTPAPPPPAATTAQSFRVDDLKPYPF